MKIFGVFIGFLCLLSCNQTKNKMKELEVLKIDVASVKPENLSSVLDETKVQYQSLDVLNWEEFSYRPEVKFRIAYSDEGIYLNYKVKEKSVRAKYGTDNGKVWTDACVEFFVIPGGDSIYYNFEFNCIGTMLLAAGSGRDARESATPDIMEKVERWSSLGNEPFDERIGETEWELSLIIPYSAFFKHRIASPEGKTIRANFYKCGDELTTPHFVSWNPIGTEKPDFHRPEYFGVLKF